MTISGAGHPPPLAPLLAPPASCPACATGLLVTRLQCPSCSTEVTGVFQRDAGRLVNLPEPHASLLELFLHVRGNVKDVERTLGLSYPTVRARLEEAFAAARPKLTPQGMSREAASPPASAGPADSLPLPTHQQALATARAPVLDALERGEITPTEAVNRLRALNVRSLNAR